MAKETIHLEVKSDIGKVSKEIGEVSKETKDLTNNFGAFGITIGSIKDKFKDMAKIMKNGFKQIILQARLAGAGFKSMFSGKIIAGAKALFTVIKTGIAATGIGLLVVAFGSLVAYVTNTKKGAELLERTLKTVGAAISVITDRVAKLGGAVIKFLTGDLKGAAEDAKAAVSGVVAEINAEVDATNKMVTANQKLRDAQRELNVETAQSVADIEKLKLIAEDITKSYGEREAAATQAFEKETDLENKRIALAEQAVALEVERHRMMGKDGVLAQDLDALSELEINLANVRQESAGRQISLQNFLNGLRDTEKAEIQAAADKKKADDDAEAKRKQDQIDAEFDAMVKANEAWNAEQAEQFAKTAADDATLLELQQQNSLAAIENLKERALAELTIQQEKELASAELMENSEAMKAAIEEKYTGKRAEVEKKFNKDKKKWSEMSAKAQLDIMSQTAGNMVKILGEETAAGKAMAVTQATIDTYKGATAAYASMAGIPVVGPALGAVAAAAAVAAGLANVKAILSANASGGGGGGAPSSAGASAEAPAPEMLSGKFELGGGEAPEPLKAFVVTDEMTNSQDQLANIRRRATV